MQVVVREPKTHHHRRNLKHVLEISHDWNRTARTNEYRLLLERVVQRLGRRLDEAIVGADHAGRTLAPDFNFRLDSLRREFLHERRVAIKDVLRILIRHKPHRNLRRSPCRNYRLRSRSHKTPRYAMHLERGARPGPVKHGIAWLAGQHLRSDFSLAILLFIK